MWESVSPKKGLPKFKKEKNMNWEKRLKSYKINIENEFKNE
ncbi:MAG: hypothetical protein ACRC4M_01195 [Mycoplasma sp.]